MELKFLNPGLLQRQMRLLDDRLQELETERTHLLRMREACQVLLSAAAPQASSPEPKKIETKTTPADDLAGRVMGLLRDNGGGLTAETIFDELKSQGVPFRRKEPLRVLYKTLEKHPELFNETSDGRWVRVRDTGSQVPSAGETRP